MNQQINLYQFAFHENRLRLSAKTLLQGLVAVVLVFLFLTILQGQQFLQLKHQVVYLEHQYSFLKSQSADLDQSLRTGHLDESLAEQVQKLENKLNSQQQLQTLLNDDLFNSDQGYSRYLIALAQQHISGLWLTGIVLTGAGRDIALRGEATQADLLPRYLQKLSREPILQGMELRVFQLNRNDDKTKSQRSGAFNFQVATATANGDQP